MLHLLKRHPIAVEAKFDYTLVLTYALPAELLQPLLFPGLVLDTFVMVEGVRSEWRPRNIEVDAKTVEFFHHPPFRNAEPRLASAFYIENIPYWWKEGICESLASPAVATSA